MSTTSAISSTANANGSNDTVTGPSQTLSQNDFLQLLVTQMTSQDPMNPTSDTQMAAQMAQFTSLQQTSTMSSNIAVMQANGMLGSTVSLQADPNTVVKGVVSGVQLNGSSPPQIIVNGTPYNLSQVLSIKPTPVAPTSSSVIPSVLSTILPSTILPQTISNITSP
jgi:flagellar basal-body rod modification protein FlgD